MLLKSHLGIKCHTQFIKVTRFLQHSSTNGYWGDLGCIVCDLETIIVLVFLAFNLILQRMKFHYYHSLTFSTLCFRDSDTASLTPADSTTAIKV